MPFDVQLELVHSVPGLEKAILQRPAYAVEYDFAPPTQIFPSLESKKVENLFFAGQINGTSGYEEAASQGLVAGVNAANKTRGLPPLVVGRHEGYIGVLIDDLVTKGTNEPYRMFTSRAEYRLLFNHGSAELRLLHHAKQNGLVSSSRAARIEEKKQTVEGWVARLETTRADGEGIKWGDLIRRTSAQNGMSVQGEGRGLAMLPVPEGLGIESIEVRNEVLYRVSYAGYLQRESRQIEKLSDLEGVRIPADMDFKSIRGLCIESAQKLAAFKPFSLGQASRISGVSPSDIGVLMVVLNSRTNAKRVGRPSES